jgi:Na+-translocating ferredoxin:NAD+ oxidoreductase RnfE subunit
MLPKTDPLLPLLAVCALAIASPTMAISIASGATTLVALAAGHGLFVALRRPVPDAVRFVVYLLVLATVVCATGLLVQAWWPQPLARADVSLPLIVAACAIFGRGGVASMREALFAGLACTAALLLCGALREWIGNAALFAPLAFALVALLFALRNQATRP